MQNNLRPFEDAVPSKAQEFDEVLALDAWRLRRLDDAQRLLAAGRTASLLVSRDQRLLTLPLEVPAPADVPGSVGLLVDAKAPRCAQALRRAWIGR